MRQPGEPSVEEILESIKKVIARDNRAEADDLRQPRDAVSAIGIGPVAEPSLDSPASEPAADILDLSDPADYAHEALEIDDADDHYDDEPAIVQSPAPLVTEDARISMRDSLTALAMLSAPGAPPQIVRSGETSLEGMARELLRPALAEWLEKNLPPLVERMVAAEIARIAGKRG
jgi:uncharacterized protein